MFKKNIFKENLIAFAIALVLSLVFVFAINNTSMLRADITVINHDNTNVEDVSIQDWDIVFLTEWNNFELFANKNFNSVSTISFYITFDSEKVSIEDIDEAIDSDFDYSFASLSNPNQLNIILTNISSFKKWDKIMQFDLTADPDEVDIILSDITMWFTDGTAENLLITTK